ncbi:unnamed protein product [Paramecium pentaurelia]|uniref:Uncharacterized protein n=1 Tax=Paramecium pentaurelia TaxID=43138 RepID=A0A8S1XM28_9CILI|nr:unnamed protein product [Paramecium pentaurelia]
MLFGELEGICKQKQLNLGITQEWLPDKKWLAKILFILDEKNEIFQIYYLLRGLDTLGEGKNSQIFFDDLINMWQKTKLRKLNRNCKISKLDCQKKED